jgi:isocitrate dehydrogenase kinase/phosphatase
MCHWQVRSNLILCHPELVEGLLRREVEEVFLVRAFGFHGVIVVSFTYTDVSYIRIFKVLQDAYCWQQQITKIFMLLLNKLP